MKTAHLKAVQGRIAFEQKKIAPALLQSLYMAYANIPDVPSFIEAALRIFPKLNCGLASVYLRHVLKKGKIVQGSYQQNDHTFLLVKDTVIDITSDQDGGPKVYVGPLKNPWAIKN